MGALQIGIRGLLVSQESSPIGHHSSLITFTPSIMPPAVKTPTAMCTDDTTPNGELSYYDCCHHTTACDGTGIYPTTMGIHSL